MVAVALLGLAGWTALQLVPLPEPVVGVISPLRLEWHRTLQPEKYEVLPGEGEGAARPGWLTLSVDPSATRTFLARIIGMLAVYLVCRNWLATRASFRRFAWVLAALGSSLAVFALAQHFSSSVHTVYWSIEVEGGVFGPFICRNHYPDFVGICLGFVVALMIPTSHTHNSDGARRREAASLAEWFTPVRVGLACAAGLIAASIAVSLSRGGMLAGLGAAVGALALSRSGARGRASFAVGVGVVGSAAVGAGLLGWLGADRIQARLATLGTAEATISRGPMWRDVVQLAPQSWATGVGAGSFLWAESLTKAPDRSPEDAFENAHNEYLEALIEGGAPRLALTLAMTLGALAVIGRGFRRRRDRSVGPLLLGAWFGLAMGALHSAVDFAIHMPAVALLTAAAAGYAMAAASDSQFLPTPSGEGPCPPERSRRVALRGWKAMALAPLPALVVLLAAWGARDRERAFRLKAAADVAYWQTGAPDRLARRAAYLDARAALLPQDSTALFDAAQGRIDAAVELAVAGTASPDRFPAEAVDRHLRPALAHLRAARAANPIAPKVHTRLALFAEYFAEGEACEVHFDRAKKLLAADPEVWRSSGKASYRRGNWTAAWADWREALARSSVHLREVVELAGKKLSPAEVCELVLPDDPAVILAAADLMAPVDRGASEERRACLVRATRAGAGRPGWTGGQLAARARAFDELGDSAAAFDCWRGAVAGAPDDVEVRNAFSRWLEREERYEEALPHLEWLRDQRAAGAVQDRIDIVNHGLKLKRVIGPR